MTGTNGDSDVKLIPQPSARELPNEGGPIAVKGTSTKELLASAMHALLPILREQPEFSSSTTKTLRIRGEGSTAGQLMLSLSRTLLEELDAMNVAPIEISIDGIVRSESGLIAWASVGVEDRIGQSPIASIELASDVGDGPEGHSFLLHIIPARILTRGE